MGRAGHLKYDAGCVFRTSSARTAAFRIAVPDEMDPVKNR